MKNNINSQIRNRQRNKILNLRFLECCNVCCGFINHEKMGKENQNWLKLNFYSFINKGENYSFLLFILLKNIFYLIASLYIENTNRIKVIKSNILAYFHTNTAVYLQIQYLPASYQDALFFTSPTVGLYNPKFKKGTKFLKSCQSHFILIENRQL